jgi:predicted RNase H-related nuclease YkuK (DUF458 family)
MWSDPNSNQYPLEEVIKFIDDNTHVIIGSDSQLVGGKWNFATVICIYRQGKGGRFFFKRDKREKSTYKNLDVRLMDEVHGSVMVAEAVRELKPSANISIHADIASDPDSSSNKVAKIAQSYVIGMGYVPTIKPDSWAASAVADKISK